MPDRRSVVRLEPSAPRLYRALRAGCRLIAGLLRFRFVLEGADHLPRTPDGRAAGGWIAAGLPHRTWIDPFVLALLLPAEPRLVFFGDGRALFRSPIRRLVFRLVGGVVPIWPGGGARAFEGHVAAATAALEAGAVFGLFPEVGPPVPVDEARPLSPGIGYFSLRSGAPIVPLVIGGGHELFLGRRLILRVLPPAGPRELAGLPPDDPLPAPGTSEERDAARRIAAELHRRTAEAVAAVHHEAEPPLGSRKRWTWLTRAFR